MSTEIYPGTTAGAGGRPQMPAAAPSGTGKVLKVVSTSPLVLEWGADTGGAFSADGQTQITPATAIVLDEATGNEVALTLNYTTNKATSGNDTGLLINQTDTASPGTSLLADFQVSGVSKVSIGQSEIVMPNQLAGAEKYYVSIQNKYSQKVGFYVAANDSDYGVKADNVLTLQAANWVSMKAASATLTVGAINTNQTQFYNSQSGRMVFGANSSHINEFLGHIQASTDILELRNGTNAQTFRVYSTYTDSSNGDWLSLTKAAGGDATISTEANGTGTAGNIILAPGAAKSVVMDKTTEDDGFINFKATADADATSAISTLTTSGSVTHHIQIEINGVTAWIPCSTTDPS